MVVVPCTSCACRRACRPARSVAMAAAQRYRNPLCSASSCRSPPAAAFPGCQQLAAHGAAVWRPGGRVLCSGGAGWGAGSMAWLAMLCGCRCSSSCTFPCCRACSLWPAQPGRTQQRWLKLSPAAWRCSLPIHPPPPPRVATHQMLSGVYRNQRDFLNSAHGGMVAGAVLGVSGACVRLLRQPAQARVALLLRLLAAC